MFFLVVVIFFSIQKEIDQKIKTDFFILYVYKKNNNE